MNRDPITFYEFLKKILYPFWAFMTVLLTLLFTAVVLAMVANEVYDRAVNYFVIDPQQIRAD